MRELTLPGRMILLPGFGCDGRIFGPQRRAFGDRLETPDPIAPVAHETLTNYAQRWAIQLSRPGDDTPLVLGGLSLGGILALEMAKHIEPKPRAVLLIASTRRADRWSFAVQAAQSIGQMVPMASANKAASCLALAFAMRDGLDDDGKQLLRTMAKDMDPALVKWAGKAAMDWPGISEDGAGLPPIHHIHGKQDWVIDAADEADQVIELGRHLINHSNATTVNHFLFEKMIQHIPQAQINYPGIEDPRATAQRRLTLEGAPAGTPLV